MLLCFGISFNALKESAGISILEEICLTINLIFKLHLQAMDHKSGSSSARWTCFTRYLAEFPFNIFLSLNKTKAFCSHQWRKRSMAGTCTIPSPKIILYDRVCACFVSRILIHIQTLAHTRQLAGEANIALSEFLSIRLCHRWSSIMKKWGLISKMTLFDGVSW